VGDLVGEVTGDVLRSVIGAHGDAARDTERVNDFDTSGIGI
jgi:hypothetical protein